MPDQNFTLPIPSSYQVVASLTSTWALCISFAFSCTCCLFHISWIDTSLHYHECGKHEKCDVWRCYVHSSFGFGLLGSSQSLHSSTNQWNLAANKLQGNMYIISLSLLLYCLCSCFCNVAFVQRRNCLCHLICFLIALCENLLKLRHIFLLLCAMRFCMLNFHQYFFQPQKLQFFPKFDPLICITRFRINCISVLFSTAHLSFFRCRHAPWWVLEKTKAVNSALLNVRCNSKFCLHRAVQPMQRPQFFVIVRLHHWPATCSQVSSGTQKRAVSGNVALETFCWHAPVFLQPCSHGFHWVDALQHLFVISIPFFWGSRLLISLSENLWDLPSDLVPFWALVEPVLFCAFHQVTGLALSSDQPKSKSPFCTQRLSRKSVFATALLSSFAAESELAPVTLPSFKSSCSCLAAHVSQ